MHTHTHTPSGHSVREVSKKFMEFGSWQSNPFGGTVTLFTPQ